MARKSRSRTRGRWRLHLAALIVLAGLVGAVWYWWDMRQWAPDEALYPDQGIAIDQRHGLTRFDTVRALGGKFAYLGASRGADGQDTRFVRNLAAARQAGVKAGAVHVFDPFVRAYGQSANFARVVPRDPQLLPPVILLDRAGDACERKASDAAVESELLTLINQIEMHAGKPVILKPTEAFEARYHVGERFERDLWLVRGRFEPDYAGRPWLLWSANMARVTEAADEPVEWAVVQP